MIWYKLILFILTTGVISYVVTTGALFKKLRENVSRKNEQENTMEFKNYWYWFLDEILNCPLCFGFWAGILVYLAVYVCDFSWLCYPFVGAITSYWIYLITKKLKQ